MTSASPGWISKLPIQALRWRRRIRSWRNVLSPNRETATRMELRIISKSSRRKRLRPRLGKTTSRVFIHSTYRRWRSRERWESQSAVFRISSEGNNMAPTIETVEENPHISSTAREQNTSQPREPLPTVVPRRRRVPRWALFVVPVIVLVVLLSWWLSARRFESTDDAQIDGHLNAISARISGTVLYINPKVEDNQYIESGNAAG